MDAARPYYRSDGTVASTMSFGHNLPVGIIRMYGNWFHLYMHPTDAPPLLQRENLTESVRARKSTLLITKIIRAE
jgi:hypothetical protein